MKTYIKFLLLSLVSVILISFFWFGNITRKNNQTNKVIETNLVTKNKTIFQPSKFWERWNDWFSGFNKISTTKTENKRNKSTSSSVKKTNLKSKTKNNGKTISSLGVETASDPRPEQLKPFTYKQKLEIVLGKKEVISEFLEILFPNKYKGLTKEEKSKTVLTHNYGGNQKEIYRKIKELKTKILKEVSNDAPSDVSDYMKESELDFWIKPDQLKKGKIDVRLYFKTKNGDKITKVIQTAENTYQTWASDLKEKILSDFHEVWWDKFSKHLKSHQKYVVNSEFLKPEIAIVRKVGIDPIKSLRKKFGDFIILPSKFAEIIKEEYKDFQEILIPGFKSIQEKTILGFNYTGIPGSKISFSAIPIKEEEEIKLLVRVEDVKANDKLGKILFTLVVKTQYGFDDREFKLLIEKIGFASHYSTKEEKKFIDKFKKSVVDIIEKKIDRNFSIFYWRNKKAFKNLKENIELENEYKVVLKNVNFDEKNAKISFDVSFKLRNKIGEIRYVKGFEFSDFEHSYEDKIRSILTNDKMKEFFTKELSAKFGEFKNQLVTNAHNKVEDFYNNDSKLNKGNLTKILILVDNYGVKYGTSLYRYKHEYKYDIVSIKTSVDEDTGNLFLNYNAVHKTDTDSIITKSDRVTIGGFKPSSAEGIINYLKDKDLKNHFEVILNPLKNQHVTWIGGRKELEPYVDKEKIIKLYGYNYHIKIFEIDIKPETGELDLELKVYAIDSKGEKSTTKNKIIKIQGFKKNWKITKTFTK